jgi:hypothetical protein
MKTSPEEIKSKLGVLILRMDFIQVKPAIYQDEIMAVIRSSQEKMEAAINSICIYLEETMKHQVEDILVPVKRLTQDHREELSRKI